LPTSELPGNSPAALFLPHLSQLIGKVSRALDFRGNFSA